MLGYSFIWVSDPPTETNNLWASPEFRQQELLTDFPPIQLPTATRASNRSKWAFELAAFRQCATFQGHYHSCAHRMFRERSHATMSLSVAQVRLSNLWYQYFVAATRKRRGKLNVVAVERYFVTRRCFGCPATLSTALVIPRIPRRSNKVSRANCKSLMIVAALVLGGNFSN